MAPINLESSMGVIRLGPKQLPVVPQKHARLRRYLSPEDFRAVLSKEYSHNSYRLLCILIPAMDPKNPQAEDPVQEWEFDGFPTEEAWERYKTGDQDAYDENNDPSPTTDEIAIAFETALRVNGAGRLGKIMTLVEMSTKVIEIERETRDDSSTQLGNSGESHPTSSGTILQTPSVN